MKSFCNIHPVGTIVKKLLMTDHREIITEAKDKREKETGQQDNTTGQHRGTGQQERRPDQTIEDNRITQQHIIPSLGNRTGPQANPSRQHNNKG